MTGELTRWIAVHGAYAVFGLMVIDALIPAFGELTMIIAGALAGGAVAGTQPALFGVRLDSGLEAYLGLSFVGVVGSIAGALLGWWLGAHGGRRLIERYWPGELDRASRWFERYGDSAVLIGRLTPMVRSFISIPAGALGSPLRRYTVLSLAASVLWCFGLAAAGWALRAAWSTLDHYAAYADVVVVVSAITAVVVLRRARRA